jgi:hypothetical protein
MAKPLPGQEKMPKKPANGEDGSKFIGLRLDRDTAAYYSKRAKERGTTLSEFLRTMIVQGMIAEMQIQTGGGGSAKLPENALMSIYTSEQLLTKIVEARNPQDLYDAQDRAKAKIKREKGEANG